MTEISSSDYIAVASAVVAFCALAVSIWQGAITRRHNILSVRPHVELQYVAIRGEPQKLTLRNVGLGPAIGIRVKIVINGISIELDDERSYMNLIVAFDCGGIFTECVHYSFDAQSALGMGETLEIFNISSSHSADQLWEKFGRAGRKLEVTTEYKDIYGTKYLSHQRHKSQSAT